MVGSSDIYHSELAQQARTLRQIAEAIKHKADSDYAGAKTEVVESLREALNPALYLSDDEYEAAKSGAQRDYEAGMVLARDTYDAEIERANYVAQAARLVAMAAKRL